MIFDQPNSVFRATVFALVLAAAFVFLPLWGPLMLAAWVAGLARPLLVKLAGPMGGRMRAAALLVVAMVLLMLLPLGFALSSLAKGAADLGTTLMSSDGAKNALVEVVSGGKGDAVSLDDLKSSEKIIALVQEYGGQAATIIGRLFGAAATGALGLFVFVYGVLVFLVDGPAQWKWVEDHSPLDLTRMRRLHAAFNETGRGLFVGIGLTGLSQGLVATAAYVALGVPRALVLGLLTCAGSLIPSVGTALVWVPVAAGLALSGRTGAAVIMVVVGIAAVSMIDNVLRPVFARFGKLDLSTFVVLTSIFGGLALVGAWGLFLGPLLVRLAKEALLMARETRPEVVSSAPK